MILDDFIKRLEEIKNEHDGNLLVYVEYDYVYEQICDIDEVNFRHPAGEEIDAGWAYGVLIG